MGAGAVLALAGGAMVLLRPGLEDGRLSPAGRDIFAAVARGVLGGLLPVDPVARAQAIQSHLGRLDNTIGGLPPALQAEINAAK